MKQIIKKYATTILTILLWLSASIVTNAQNIKQNGSLTTETMAKKIAISVGKSNTLLQSYFYQANKIPNIIVGDEILANITKHYDYIENFIVYIIDIYGITGGWLTFREIGFTPEEYDKVELIYYKKKNLTKNIAPTPKKELGRNKTKSLVSETMAKKIAIGVNAPNSSLLPYFYEANNIDNIRDGDRILMNINQHFDCAEKFIIFMINFFGEQDGWLVFKGMEFTPMEYNVAKEIYNEAIKSGRNITNSDKTNEIKNNDDEVNEKKYDSSLDTEESWVMNKQLSDFILHWTQKHIKYPEDALSEGIQGYVIVKYNLESDGTINNVRIVRGLCPSIDNETIRVLKSIPQKQILKTTKEFRSGEYTQRIPFRFY